MPRRRRKPASILLIALAATIGWVGPAASEGEEPTEPTKKTQYPYSDFLSGNWGGYRDMIYDFGIDFQVTYTTQPLSNTGGDSQGTTYTDNWAFDFLLDLDKLVGIPATTFLARVSDRNGNNLSAKRIARTEDGHPFTVQEIYGGSQTTKLVNFQVNTRAFHERLELAVGRLFSNDDFLRSPLYCQFVNNSFCGSQKAVFLQNPGAFTAYPSAQWGGRAKYDTEDNNWTLMAAVYDGDPDLKSGNPRNPGGNQHGTNWRAGGNGVTYVGEVHFHLNRESKESLPGVYKIGGYHMTGNFEDIGRIDNETTGGNHMGWVTVDQMLYREEDGSDEGLWGFASYVRSFKQKVNDMSDYVSAGLVYEGLIPGRDRDKTGLAFSLGWYSDSSDDAREAEGKDNKDYEGVIELNHNFIIGRGLEFQPDLQYVIRPAGTGEVDNAFVFGAKIKLHF